MMTTKYDSIIIGGGPAGLAAAIKAKELGLNVLLLENRDVLGGIPLQCLHPGFGLHYFKEDLTGTEFIYRFIDKFQKMGIEYFTNAHLTEIENISDTEKRIKVITSKGLQTFTAKTIIYATGARERHLYEIGVTGKRLPGIFTAGEAQTMMDVYGIMPGKEIVIVGSGDVGLIMARRFALEGATVKAVIELMPFPGGLTRNVVQCLDDFGIPLYLSHAVTRVEGDSTVEKVIISEVNERLEIKEGTEKEIKCDTVVVAAGLVPYIKILEKIGVVKDQATRGPIVNEYLETLIPGVFTAGNALVINDLVDHVVEQGELAAFGASEFVKNEGIPTRKWKRVFRGRNVRLLVPHYVSGENDVIIYARVSRPMNKVKVRFPEINKEVRLPVVKPAEMISIKLKKEEIQRAVDRITMEVLSNE
ncbi:MAG: hypothetical protein PWP54_697 [Thermosipho sp. (in: thermotogales)]|nr:hypothetical protein [Thermosipho sp. (in: thermotogales)]